MQEQKTGPRTKADYVLDGIKRLLTSKLPAPMVLMMIVELIEHGPGIAQKLIR